MKNSLSIWCTLFVFFQLWHSVVSAQSPIRDSIYVFSSNRSPEDIQLQPLTYPYSEYEDQKIDFGLVTPQKWCYMLLKASVSQAADYVLSVDNTSIDTVMLFQVTADGTEYKAYTGGNMVPYAQNRKYVWHTMPLLLNQKPSYYLAAFQDKGRNINVGIRIMTINSLSKLYSHFDHLIWFYLGLAFLIFVVTLIGGIVIQSRPLGYYSLFILGITFWVLSHYGYLFPMLYPRSPWLNDVVKPLSILLALLSLRQLIVSLFFSALQIDKASRNILKVIFWAGIFVLAVLIASPFLSGLQQIPVLCNLLYNAYFAGSSIFLLLVLIKLFNKSNTARLFTLAFGLMIAMSLQQVASNSGVLYSELLNNHGILLATMVEIFILSYAVFLNIERSHKEAARRIVQLNETHTKTLEQLVTVQDNERKRIAGELHDSIGPMLAAIKINFLRMTRTGDLNDAQYAIMEKAGDIIDNSMIEIRSISHQLMPKELLIKGLVTSLSELVDNHRIVYNTSIDFSHDISELLSKDIQLNVYRIISELVLNAVRHSKAPLIKISLEASNECVFAMVQDNGIGFDIEKIKDSSFGLKNLESRVQYLKGKMELNSNVGGGTRVLITIPQT